LACSRPQPGLQRQTVDQLLQVLSDKNLPAPFDEGVLRDIVADPRQWKDLTPVEARQSRTRRRARSSRWRWT
jgi:hypothetical protein